MYTPHLTLGRVREISREEGRRVREWLAQVAAPLATSRVDRVTLYRSHLTPSGSRYEALLEMPLADPAEIV
jgi:2'-5' RNA ligase